MEETAKRVPTLREVYEGKETEHHFKNVLGWDQRFYLVLAQTNEGNVGLRLIIDRDLELSERFQLVDYVHSKGYFLVTSLDEVAELSPQQLKDPDSWWKTGDEPPPLNLNS